MARKKVATVHGDLGTASIHWDREWCEYVVTPNGDTKAAYFTDCLDDAKGTAKAMLAALRRAA